MPVNEFEALDPFVSKVAHHLNPLLSALDKQLGKIAEKRVLVGFSGGPDSCSLMVALAEIRAFTAGLEVSACHVNHGLRGDESDADELFCISLCNELGIPILVRKVIANETDEATLRELRYNSLVDACRETASTLCLTGHTVDDQIETVLFRLFRGSAPAGLVGMDAVRELASGIFLGRPLLKMRRQECIDFLASRGRDFRVDSSNSDVNYTRNYIRRIILPVIEDKFPGVVDRIEKTRHRWAMDDEELQRHARKALENLEKENWTRSTFNQMSDSIKLRVIEEALLERGISPAHKRVEQIANLLESNKEQQAAINLDSNWTVSVQNDRLNWRFASPDDEVQKPLESMPEYEVRSAGLTIMPRYNICLHVRKLGPEEACEYPPADADEILADLNKVQGPLVLRARRPGDVITPLGMGCEVRLKKYLHTRKTAGLLRFWGHTLVLADDIGVVWVPGCGISARIAVTAHDIWRLSISSVAPDAGSFC